MSLKSILYNGEYVIIKPVDILFAQAESCYCQIITKEKSFVVAKTLKEVTEFFGLTRVHRSYSINPESVIKINSKDSEIWFTDKKSCFYARNFDIHTLIEHV